ncbi:hypothetical protein, partial [Yersinia aleksiciae]
MRTKRPAFIQTSQSKHRSNFRLSDFKEIKVIFCGVDDKNGEKLKERMSLTLSRGQQYANGASADAV